MTIIGVIVGVLIVVVVGIGQLGGKVSGTLKDPQMAYKATLLDGSSIGKADAPVTMDVWEDYQCPICARYSLTVEPVLVSKYATPGSLRIVHHDLAILGRGGPDDESKLAASGAYCANVQGKYWDYAHWVYNNQDGENQGGFRRERLTAIAEAAGVEPVAFKACLDDAATIAAVADTTGKGPRWGSTPRRPSISAASSWSASRAPTSSAR
jgi:protein-disulfide isomerase